MRQPGTIIAEALFRAGAGNPPRVALLADDVLLALRNEGWNLLATPEETQEPWEPHSFDEGTRFILTTQLNDQIIDQRTVVHAAFLHHSKVPAKQWATRELWHKVMTAIGKQLGGP